MLSLDRELNLNHVDDRRVLAAAAIGDPILRRLIADHLDDYCTYLSDERWHRVNAGIVNVAAGEKHHVAFEIADLLMLVGAMKNLKDFDGFATVLKGFQNPTQIESAVFEIRAADWCRSRRVSLGLIFAPEVLVKGRVKRPEFLWRTTQGDCYCECKKSN
ncbi:MAG: hypothetical protein ABJB97_08670 [Acidobacteriota bacterium]